MSKADHKNDEYEEEYFDGQLDSILMSEILDNMQDDLERDFKDYYSLLLSLQQDAGTRNQRIASKQYNGIEAKPGTRTDALNKSYKKITPERLSRINKKLEELPTQKYATSFADFIAELEKEREDCLKKGKSSEVKGSSDKDEPSPNTKPNSSEKIGRENNCGTLPSAKPGL